VEPRGRPPLFFGSTGTDVFDSLVAAKEVVPVADDCSLGGTIVSDEIYGSVLPAKQGEAPMMTTMESKPSKN